MLQSLEVVHLCQVHLFHCQAHAFGPWLVCPSDSLQSLESLCLRPPVACTTQVVWAGQQGVIDQVNRQLQGKHRQTYPPVLTPVVLLIQKGNFSD
jgi:hypothetical protein